MIYNLDENDEHPIEFKGFLISFNDFLFLVSSFQNIA